MGCWELEARPSSQGFPAGVSESGLGGILGLSTTAEAPVLLLVQGVDVRGKIEKSIEKAVQKKKE